LSLLLILSLGLLSAEWCRVAGCLFHFAVLLHVAQHFLSLPQHVEIQLGKHWGSKQRERHTHTHAHIHTHTPTHTHTHTHTHTQTDRHTHTQTRTHSLQESQTNRKMGRTGVINTSYFSRWYTLMSRF